MSAIFGIYYSDGRPVLTEDLERMAGALAHRGPDGTGVWSEGPAGLGHRMLWTTPESLHERLPHIGPEGDIAITADARIDNREELIGLLGLDDYPDSEIADSDLILAAYEEWGEHCPERLLGDFAFAIWDRRKQTLFCARDHFGVKPFFYHLREGAFIFATEIKALLCLAEVPKRINEVKVADFLGLVDNDFEITFYRDILRLPPRHSLTVTREGARLRPYWSLDPTRELRLGSDREYAEAFRSIFTEAVRCRMRSAYPAGTMLSGGLDSSAITCVARDLQARNGNGRLQTFSAVFDEVTQCDERPFINAVLSQNGVEANFFHADQVGPLSDLDRVLWHQDEALCAGNLYLNWHLYGLARKRGIRVMLDGFDGDTTVSHGTGYFMELARARRWLTLIGEARGFARHFPNCRPWHLAFEQIERHGLSPTMRRSIGRVRRVRRAISRRARRLIGHSIERQAQRSIINPDFAKRVELEDRRRKLRQERSRPVRTERDVHYNKLSWPLMAETLDSLDRVAGAFSIEVRFPFWDRRLVEFCLSLPPEQKLNNGWIRMVMRRGLEGVLPREVQWRGGKMNLSPSFKHGLLTYDRARLETAAIKNMEAIGDYVDVTSLREIYERFLNRQTVESEELALWKAVSLSVWLQRMGGVFKTQERRNQYVK